ncbi:MAG: 30S ribosomal protein S5 [Candidatus Syntropharchaeia archaeon]
MSEEWIPKTRLGMMVKEKKITHIDEVLTSPFPVKEPEIIDTLLPDLEEEVLDVNMVQRMTDSGRRLKFRVCVVVGNRDGYVGVGEGKDVQVGPAIGKAIKDAKLNLIGIRRGCGSWECDCELLHSVPFQVVGKCGSVRITIMPAPRGLGLASGETAKKVLELAGIEDAWTKTKGKTKTTLNFAKATFDALRQTAIFRGI